MPSSGAPESSGRRARAGRPEQELSYLKAVLSHNSYLLGQLESRVMETRGNHGQAQEGQHARKVGSRFNKSDADQGRL